MNLTLTEYPFAGLDVTGPEARRLGDLHAEAAGRIAAVRDVRAAAAAALAGVGEASEALTAGLEREAAGDKVDAVKLTAKLRESEKTAGEPWAQRIDAAERVARRAVAAYERYAQDDEQVAAALHAEALPYAYADQARKLRAYEELAAATEAGHAHERRMVALSRLCGYQAREELPAWSEPPSPKRLRADAERVPCVYPARYAPTPETEDVEVAA